MRRSLFVGADELSRYGSYGSRPHQHDHILVTRSIEYSSRHVRYLLDEYRLYFAGHAHGASQCTPVRRHDGWLAGWVDFGKQQ